MALSPIFKKAYWSLAALGGIWFLFLSSLINPWLQRHGLYAHKLHTAWWEDLDQPEKWGYLSNQIQPFNISTPDGETLYAWHILPLGAYVQNEARLLNDPKGVAEDITRTAAFDVLTERSDPKTKLVINFHGNAGTVGQGWRTDTYRSLSSGDTSKIHVLAFDYRGFGRSTGNPTEQGLITDGIAVVDWALEVAKIPPERIVLLGQSLGTAVATAVAEHFCAVRGTHFAGLVLAAGFSNLPKLVTTYAIGGVVPILSPLRPYPRIQDYFSSKIVDTWETAARLTNFMRISKRANLAIIHARDDFDIHYSHADMLFYAAANGTSEEGLTIQQMDEVKVHEDLGMAGWQNTWTAEGIDGGLKRIRQRIMRYGGHNRIMTYSPIGKMVLEILKAAE